jgi:hypothetical protein
MKTNQNRPTCPECGSTDISGIVTGTREVRWTPKKHWHLVGKWEEDPEKAQLECQACGNEWSAWCADGR